MEIHKSPVEDISQLRTFCDKISSSSSIAIDTEFTRIRTYRPHLQLVQLATEEFVFCVDAVLCSDISPLMKLLSLPSVTVVLHSAEQDLEVLCDFGAVPKRIFDTQIAAKICGYQNISYKDVVQELVGISLDKGMTRSNWKRRPLTQDQIRYALDDVRYLVPLQSELSLKLKTMGRTAWLEEECRSMLRSSQQKGGDDSIWKPFRLGASLSVSDQHLAYSLLVWREKRAQKIDWPRKWVMSDEHILRIVKKPPNTVAHLMKILELKSSKSAKWMSEVLTVLQSIPDSTSPVWDLQDSLTSREKSLTEKIQYEIGELAVRHNLPATLICTKREANAIARGKRDGRIFSGWRKQITATLIDNLLSEYDSG